MSRFASVRGVPFHNPAPFHLLPSTGQARQKQPFIVTGVPGVRCDWLKYVTGFRPCFAVRLWQGFRFGSYSLVPLRLLLPTDRSTYPPPVICALCYCCCCFVRRKKTQNTFGTQQHSRLAFTAWRKRQHWIPGREGRSKKPIQERTSIAFPFTDNWKSEQNKISLSPRRASLGGHVCRLVFTFAKGAWRWKDEIICCVIGYTALSFVCMCVCQPGYSASFHFISIWL